MEDVTLFILAKGKDMNSGQLLYQGMRAFKTGRVDEARRLWELVVAQDEANEMAWLGLSSVIEDSAQRRVCLENVLCLNPDNEVARERLAMLPERKSKQPFWLWRWLTKGSATSERAYPCRIQPLESARRNSKLDATGNSKPAEWQSIRTYFFFVGIMGFVLLTALLIVVI